MDDIQKTINPADTELPSGQDTVPTEMPEIAEVSVSDEAAVETAPASESFEFRLEQAESKASEHYDALLRARAELENLRRRSAEDVLKAQKFAVEKFAADLLSVKDTLEMALLDSNYETMKTGVEMTLKNLVQAFEKARIQEVNPVGQRFDPNCHQAMSMVPSEQEPNSVVQVFQKGYLLSERVLRPALVAVAQAK